MGVPATLNLAVPSLTISALNAILAGFSEVYVLVLGVYYKLQTFLYLTANGIVQGIRPLVGYNYGAGEEERVHRIYRTALSMAAVIMAFGTVICLLVLAGFVLSRFLGAAGVWHGFWLTEWLTGLSAVLIYKREVRKIFSVAK